MSVVKQSFLDVTWLLHTWTQKLWIPVQGESASTLTCIGRACDRPSITEELLPIDKGESLSS